MFQHTAARRRLGREPRRHYAANCFNTQPPEGGWVVVFPYKVVQVCFNTQPPEGGWGGYMGIYGGYMGFQHTAARRRLADTQDKGYYKYSFNTQPPEGGWIPVYSRSIPVGVSTHSRPKAAGARSCAHLTARLRFNTQPPEGGWHCRLRTIPLPFWFQHTAARRRLGLIMMARHG